MNTKLMIAATVAALSLATTAFAQGGSQDSFRVPGQTIYAAPTADTGSQQYPASSAVGEVTALNNAVVPPNGSEGAVESANSLPAGAMVGTAQYAYAQSVNQYFAQQQQHRFAATHQAQPNG